MHGSHHDPTMPVSPASLSQDKSELTETSQGSWPTDHSPSTPVTGTRRRSRQEAEATAASFRTRRTSKLAIDNMTPRRSSRKSSSSSSSGSLPLPSGVAKRKLITRLKVLPKAIDDQLSEPEIQSKRRRLRLSTQIAKVDRSRTASVDSAMSANVSGGAVEEEENGTIQQSRLLRLPAELRNMIWKFAITADRPLCIIGASPTQPALTRTCRQIRNESIRFFYRENSFSCTIMNYDPTDFKEYRKRADKYGLSTVLLTHQHAKDASREVLRQNLLKWLEGTFRGETAPLGYSAGHTEQSFVWDKLSHRIVKVFNQAKLLRQCQIKLEQAMLILENAVDAAGVCGEKRR